MEGKCTLKDKKIKSKMQELIQGGASDPTSISMSDWYYIQNHAQECSYCMKRFAMLAKQFREEAGVWYDGPTTLEKE